MNPKLQKTMENSSLNPFNVLSEEILFSILDCLDNDSLALKSFSLVCKSFHLVESRHRKSLKLLRPDLLPRLLHRYPFLSQLDLSLYPRVDDLLLKKLSSLTKSCLRSINLSRSRFLSNSGLSSLALNCSNLVEIDLSNATELTDTAVAAISEAKNLERLWLVRCKLVSDIGIGCIAVGCKKLKMISLKWCLRITNLGVGLIAMKCKELRSLDLSFLPISEKCLPPILQLEHLEDLILMGCLGIDDDGLATLKEGCKSMRTLDLSNCQNISHLGLSNLTRGAGFLYQITLPYDFAVTVDVAKCLQSFMHLQCLKLDGCLVTCSAMMAIGNWCASLKELSLSKCSGVTDEGISSVMKKHTELTKLNITCCRKITGVSIDCITSLCISLTSLKMESCDLVSKEAFVLIGQRCQFLEELDVTDDDLDDEGLKSISRCAKLTSLKLGICLSITDEGLTHVGMHCSGLREIDLYRVIGITDVGIASIAHGCPSLEVINVAYCDKITDTSLMSLSKCSRLKAVELRGCTCITSEGIAAIAAGCRQLTILDMKKCFKLNDSAMIPLARYSQNLKQINLSYCSVTDVGLLALASMSRLQNMTILHLVGLTPNGLAAALLACGGLKKVKLHTSFKPLLPQLILSHMEERGCVFQWRDKPFQPQVETHLTGWKLL
ncbi:hypothetical protein Ancab_011704 [Ancistrocladus abbreviatus]